MTGPLVQAAGFARQLWALINGAGAGAAVVWEYTGGRSSYGYPPRA